MKRYISTLHGTLLGILLVAALLRLFHLGSESLWYDEAVTAELVHLDWRNFLKVLSHVEANSALYFCLLRVWVNLGESEFVLRGLSVLTGVFAVASVYVLGKRLFDPKVALIAAALLATNSFHIQYSQEARGYSLLVLFATLSSLYFLKAIENSSRMDWAAYILTATLAVYSHFFGLLVLEAHCASLVLVRSRGIPWRRLLVCFSTIGVLLIPLAIFALGRGTGQIAWVPRVVPHDAYYLFGSLVGGGRLLVLAYFVACSIASFSAIRAWLHSDNSARTWNYAFLLSWLFVPILTGFVVSLWKPVFVDRYFIICLPPIVLLAAVGISKIRARWAFVGSLAVLLLLSGRAIFRYYSYRHKEDWRGTTAYVVSHASPKDGILFYLGHGRFAFDYYVRRLNPAGQMWQLVRPEPFDRTGVSEEAIIQPGDSMVTPMSADYGRVWLVLSHNDLTQTDQLETHSIETTLQGNYPNVRDQGFRGVQVLLYSRSDGHKSY